MKKLLVVIILAILMSTLVIGGCSTETPDTTPTSTPTSTPAATTPAPAVSPTVTPTSAPTQEKVVTIKFSYTMAKGKSLGAGFEWFGPEFEKRTNGRYRVELYPSSTLVPNESALDSVTSGVCEIAAFSPGTFGKAFPLTQVTGLPTLGFTSQTPEECAMSYDAWWEFSKLPAIQAEFKDVKLLWPFVLDPWNLTSKDKEIHSAADFKGVKVGGSGGKMDIVKANGGASVNAPPPTMYMNLDKGVIDAGFTNFTIVRDYNLQEICDYFYTQDFGCGMIIVLMNDAAWNSMPAADQAIMEEVMREASLISAEGSLEGGAAGRKLVLDAGKTITDPTPEEAAMWMEAATPAFEKWEKEAIEAGATNPDATLAAWKEIRAKYLH